MLYGIRYTRLGALRSRFMDAAESNLNALLDLEARHEELLAELDALDKRVATVLKECTAGRTSSGQDEPAAH